MDERKEEKLEEQRVEGKEEGIERRREEGEREEGGADALLRTTYLQFAESAHWEGDSRLAEEV